MEDPFSVYPDAFLSLMIPLHIVCGALGAFVLCPLAAFAPKGGAVHRLAGRLLLIDVVLVALTGSLLLVDPLFMLIYWPEDSAAMGFTDIFRSAHYPEMFFLYLVVTLLYFSFSGARLWARVGHGHAERVRSNWLDWGLAIGMGGFALFFLALGILDWIHADRLASDFIAGPTVVLAFIGFDFYTFAARPAVHRFPWWFLHMTKMFVVWAGLIDAFWWRVRLKIIPAENMNTDFHIGTILWLGFTAIGVMVYRSHFRKSDRSRRP